jgi:hypothetical protein
MKGVDMPLYEVQGYGRDSNRKRSRVYSANSEEHLYQVAGDDGTIIEKWTLYEPEPTPPSQAQLAYAARLGIKLPTGVLTMEQVSDLISEATGETGHMKATPEQVAELKALGIAHEGLTREEADERLSDVETSVKWIHSVVRHHTKKHWIKRTRSGQKMLHYAVELSKDKKLMDYINEASPGLTDDDFENACEDAGLDASDYAEEWYFFNGDLKPSSQSNAYKWVVERIGSDQIEPAQAPAKEPSQLQTRFKKTQGPTPTPKTIDDESPPSLNDVLTVIMLLLTFVAFFAGFFSTSDAGLGVQFAAGLGYALVPGFITGLLKVKSVF